MVQQAQTRDADSALIGCWRIKAFDAVADRMLYEIGGRPGEYVEFTKTGKYVWDLTGDRLDSQYRAARSGDVGQLDVWTKGLEPLARKCIYRIEGDVLTICIAGSRDGKRPSALRRHDARLWCVKTLERCERPQRRRKRGRPKQLLERGSFIPKELFGPSRKVRRRK
jgi:hypothetical protein